MVYDCKRIPYWMDRRLKCFVGPDYGATTTLGLPFEPEDYQYGKSRLIVPRKCTSQHSSSLDSLDVEFLQYKPRRESLDSKPRWLENAGCPSSGTESHLQEPTQ